MGVVCLSVVILGGLLLFFFFFFSFFLLLSQLNVSISEHGNYTMGKCCCQARVKAWPFPLSISLLTASDLSIYQNRCWSQKLTKVEMISAGQAAVSCDLVSGQADSVPVSAFA